MTSIGLFTECWLAWHNDHVTQSLFTWRISVCAVLPSRSNDSHAIDVVRVTVHRVTLRCYTRHLSERVVPPGRTQSAVNCYFCRT